MRNALFALLFTLLANWNVVSAGDWEDGYAAYERQDYVTAVKKWRAVAERGDRMGQSILGAMYAQGQGVPQDYTIAIKWYRLAAAQGEVKAQYKLGFMYANGQGVSRDNLRAYMWSDLAALAGHPDAPKIRDQAGNSLNLQEFSIAKRMALECQQRKFQGCK
jgi:TPR repeat protein